VRYLLFILSYISNYAAYAIFNINDPEEPLGKRATCDTEEHVFDEGGSMTKVVITKKKIVFNPYFAGECFVTGITQYTNELKCDGTPFWRREEATSIGIGDSRSTIDILDGFWVQPNPFVYEHKWQLWDYYQQCSLPCDHCGVPEEKGPIEEEVLNQQIVDSFTVPPTYFLPTGRPSFCPASAYDQTIDALGVCARNTTRELIWINNCGPECYDPKFDPRFRIRSWTWPLDGSPPPPAHIIEPQPCPTPPPASSSSSACSSVSSKSNSSGSDSSGSDSSGSDSSGSDSSGSDSSGSDSSGSDSSGSDSSGSNSSGYNPFGSDSSGSYSSDSSDSS
jgi:hypothetical protein